MKFITSTALLFILLMGCNSPTAYEKTENKGNEAEQSKEQSAEEWDEHRFYDGLKATTLDSLGKVIEFSDSIIAYNWNDKEGNPANVQHYIVDAYGQFDDRVGRKITLSKVQKQTLKALLTDSTNFAGSNATCFIPHIAFVYYKESKVAGQSNICFLCSGVKSIPKSTSALSDKGAEELKSFCKGLGLEILDDEAQLLN